MRIDSVLLDSLTEEAKKSPRLRMNYDLRTSVEDNSQRMLNAILPGSVVPVHRHTQSTETVCVLRGRCIQHLYDDNGVEVEQVLLEANGPCMAMSVPLGQWHNLEVLEPTVIFEAKDGRYGEDGSETLDEYKAKTSQNL